MYQTSLVERMSILDKNDVLGKDSKVEPNKEESVLFGRKIKKLQGRWNVHSFTFQVFQLCHARAFTLKIRKLDGA